MPAAAMLILRHGKIVTVDRHGTIAEAVAIDGDTILHVGSTAEMQPFIGPQVVDLIAREVAAKPPGEWLVTAPVGTPPYHFDVAEMLAENHVPTRWDLDAISAENPVYIQAIWGYWGWPLLDLEAWQTPFHLRRTAANRQGDFHARSDRLGHPPVTVETDGSPIELLHALWVLLARRERETGEVIAPHQRVSRQEALRAVTLNGAYLTFEEEKKGSIEAGKWADLVVLEDDLLTLPEDQIRDLAIRATIVGGQLVYEATATPVR